eukprot:3274047-Amphidinium_carterae.1
MSHDVVFTGGRKKVLPYGIARRDLSCERILVDGPGKGSGPNSQQLARDGSHGRPNMQPHRE